MMHVRSHPHSYCWLLSKYNPSDDPRLSSLSQTVHLHDTKPSLRIQVGYDQEGWGQDRSITVHNWRRKIDSHQHQPWMIAVVVDSGFRDTMVDRLHIVVYVYRQTLMCRLNAPRRSAEFIQILSKTIASGRC